MKELICHHCKSTYEVSEFSYVILIAASDRFKCYCPVCADSGINIPNNRSTAEQIRERNKEAVKKYRERKRHLKNLNNQTSSLVIQETPDNKPID
jgi:hypothetical protein